MQIHLDALGWLHVLVGCIALVTGTAFLMLACGTASLAPGVLDEIRRNPVVWLLLVAGLVFVAGGGLMVATGRALVARRPYGRPAALLLAVVNLCLLPFGTALGVYSLWVLLNDDARREFGRRLRAAT